MISSTNAITKLFSEKFRLILLSVFFCIIGTLIFISIPIELLPKVSEQKIFISVEATGATNSASAIQLEKNVREAILQSKIITRVQSEITQKSLQILATANSKEKNNDEIIRLLIKNAFLSLNINNKFFVTTVDANSVPVLNLIVDANEKNSLEELQKLLNEKIIPSLEKLSAVALVGTKGTDEQELTLIPNIQNFYAYNTDIISTIKHISTLTQPTRYLPFGSSSNLAVSQRYPNPSELKHTKLPILFTPEISQAFTVEKKFDSRSSIVLHNNKQAALLSVYKNESASELETSGQVKQLVNQLNQSLATKRVSIANDVSNYIMASQDNVIENLKWGIIFTCLCILILMKNLRYTLIISLTIPLSLSLSFPFFSMFSITRNVMSLAGITLSVGVIVDAAINMLDGIDDYCAKGFSPFDAAVKSTKTNFVPILMTATTTLAVFIPILFLSGRVGELFNDLALTVIISQVVSFFVALFLVPCITVAIYEFFNIQIKENIEDSSPNKIGDFFAHITSIFLEKPLTYWFTSITLLLIAGWAITITPPLEFLPKRPTQDYKVVTISGFQTNPENLFKKSATINDLLKLYQATNSITIFENNTISLSFTLPHSLKSSELTIFESKINKTIPSMAFRISPVNPIDIKSTDGQDLEFFLENISNQQKSILKKQIDSVSGVANQYWHSDTFSASSFIEKDSLRYASFPIIPNSSSLFYKLAYAPQLIGFEIYANPQTNVIETYPIKILTSEQNFMHPFMPKTNVPKLLDTLTKIEPLPTKLVLVNGKIVEYISIQIRDKTAGEVASKIEKIINKNNIGVDWGEEKLDNERSTTQLTYCFSIAALLIILMLYLQNGSISSTTIIMFTFIWGLIGSLPALAMHSETLNASAIIGFILLAGTVVNNGILIIELVSRGRAKQLTPKECCIYAVKHRTIAVLVTALTTAVGMLPMVFDTGEGSQMYRALSIVVVYGTAVSTPIGLIGIPCLVLIFSDINELIAKIGLRLKIARLTFFRKITEVIYATKSKN